MGAVHLPLPLCQRRILTLRRRHGSSLCSQSEGDEPMANNATNSAVAALSSSRPSLCKQSELQCFAPVGDHAALRRPVPNPCQRTRAVRRPPLGRATSASGPCDVRLWAVRRPPLGRATSASGPCDDRLWAVRRPNTVPRSPSNRSFVPKHPFSALSPRRAALLFLLLSRRKSKCRWQIKVERLF